MKNPVLITLSTNILENNKLSDPTNRTAIRNQFRELLDNKIHLGIYLQTKKLIDEIAQYLQKQFKNVDELLRRGIRKD